MVYRRVLLSCVDNIISGEFSAAPRLDVPTTMLYLQPLPTFLLLVPNPPFVPPPMCYCCGGGSGGDGGGGGGGGGSGGGGVKHGYLQLQSTHNLNNCKKHTRCAITHPAARSNTTRVEKGAHIVIS